MKGLLAIFVAIMFAIVKGETEAMFWLVNENAIIDNNEENTLYKFLAPMPYTAMDMDNWDAPYTEYCAQVAVMNLNGDTLYYLPVGYQTGYDPSAGGPQWGFDPDITLVEIGHPNAGYVGSGNWSTQSISQDFDAEHLFQMQILQDDSGIETLLLYSDYVTGKWLKDNDYTYLAQSVAPPTNRQWMPMDFYTVSPAIPIDVPEPSTSLLCIIGFVVLMLRRKHGLG